MHTAQTITHEGRFEGFKDAAYSAELNDLFSDPDLC
jgi:hypothetical protein